MGSPAKSYHPPRETAQLRPDRPRETAVRFWNSGLTTAGITVNLHVAYMFRMVDLTYSTVLGNMLVYVVIVAIELVSAGCVVLNMIIDSRT